MIVRPLHLLSIGLLVALLSATPAFASKKINMSKVLAPYWDLLTLYEAEDHEDFVQEFRIVGRYQGQYYEIEANENLFHESSEAEGWINRRQIIGAELHFPHHWKLTAKAAISEDWDPVYHEMFELILAWHTAYSEFELGKLDFLFHGMERSYTSIEDDVIERAFLTTQLTPAEAVGLHFETELSHRLHGHFGVFDGTINEFMSSFDAGVAVAAGLGYEMPTIFDIGHFKLDYLYNDGHHDNNAFSEYRHIVSGYYEGGGIGYRVGAEMVYAHGVGERPNLWGATIMGTNILQEDFIFNQSNLSFTLRAHYAEGDNEHALGSTYRYKHHVPHFETSGEKLVSFYGGLTHRIYGDRLKLMAGIEWTKLWELAEDPHSHHPTPDYYEAVSYSLAIRTSW